MSGGDGGQEDIAAELLEGASGGGAEKGVCRALLGANCGK